MSEILLPGERIDDLQLRGLKIIQSPASFRFGMDAVLLSDFAAVRPGSRVCDLGTGTGILPLLLMGRAEDIRCDAVEIQPASADQARRTMILNDLQDRVTVHNRDLNDVRAFLPHAAYDLVISNPPYSRSDASLHSPNPALRAARTEGECDIADVICAAAYLLRGKGRFAFMLPAPRLTEVMEALRPCRMEIKRLRFVHARADRPARLCLIEAMKDARPGLTVERPLIVQTPDGADTDEIKRIYHLTH